MIDAMCSTNALEKAMDLLDASFFFQYWQYRMRSLIVGSLKAL